MYQSLAWTTSVILIALVASVFLYFAFSARKQADAGPKMSARWRNGIFWVLVIVFVPIIGYSLTAMPYARSANVGADPVVVQAVGQLWSWTLSRDQFPVGRTIEFHVTSDDVNHGFAIYDEQLQVVTQTQAMPGYTNVLRHTFTEPGTYQVLCLEYCGLAHHAMRTEFTVAAATVTQSPEVSHD